MESATPQKRGAFIVIEGLDRAGKTTQVQRLSGTLRSQGHCVETLKFPERTTAIGQLINAYLQDSVPLSDQAIHLLFAANRWEKAPWIETTLATGTTLICDRYSYSGIVYSAAKQNPGLDLAWAQAPEIGLPRPDAVVFLDLAPDAAARRNGYGDERYEQEDMQTRVRDLFMQLVATETGRARIQIIDASACVDEVARQVHAAIADVLPAPEGSAQAVFGWDVSGKS
ncbi:hypothetical protein K3495_g1422 [Podosphaera aphanis]|nr:hypothetical protein K3495_g1422 [Podosphaera aphanis]